MKNISNQSEIGLIDMGLIERKRKQRETSKNNKTLARFIYAQIKTMKQPLDNHLRKEIQRRFDVSESVSREVFSMLYSSEGFDSYLDESEVLYDLDGNVNAPNRYRGF